MKETISLRSEDPGDADFLYELFASTRADEIALTGWNAETTDQFLRSQLALQTRHYHTYYPETAFDIILKDGSPVGRLYVERGTNEIVIHDIALVPAARRRGIGSYLLLALIAEANTANSVLQIFVEQNNPALNLYLRLGFEAVKQNGIYYLMEIRPDHPEHAS